MNASEERTGDAPRTNGGWEWRHDSGETRLTIHGRLDVGAAEALWRELELRARRGGAVRRVELSGVEECDTAGIAFLQALSGGQSPAGPNVALEGLRSEFEGRLSGFSAEEYAKYRPRGGPRTGLVEEVGALVRGAAANWMNQLACLGRIAGVFVPTLLRRRTRRWAEIRRVFELAGVNALPIISLMSLLVGFIIAFEAAGAFAIFGAQIFMANLLGVIMTRELGPLLTAVMVAGRSGSAFAAELGTMKVNEELNALETMGLEPIRFLVVQRIFAGMLLTPLLTIYSMTLGVGGGVLVMLGLGFPLPTILNQMKMSVGMGDVGLGVLKGIVFGGIVATVGCLQGLETGRGPAAVGASTTRAVVAGILLVIVADAIFSVVDYALGS